MTEASTPLTAPGARVDRASARRRRELTRLLVSAGMWAFVLGNLGGILYISLFSGDGDALGYHWNSFENALLGLGRLTAFLAGFMALLVVFLLARIPFLERTVGFDRLTVWHRWNGHACIDLILAHVVFTVWGYALVDGFPLSKEISTMLGGGIYPGMVTATVATGLFIAVVGTSLVVVRRSLRYEWWYAVHLLAYAAIALSWFHEIPTGNELVLSRVA
jgi:predicted ferric reductase